MKNCSRIKDIYQVDYKTFNRALRILRKIGSKPSAFESLDDYLNSDCINKPLLNNTTYFHRHSTAVNSINDYLELKYAGKWYRLVLDKTEDLPAHTTKKITKPNTAASTFVKMVKPDKIDLQIANLGATHYANEKYIGQTLENCICYDRNKAYLATCRNLVAPTEFLGDLKRAPKKDEIGFNPDGVPHYGPSKVLCRWIFKAGYLPGLTKWATYIQEKQSTCAPEEKKYWKNMANIAIGNLGNKHNTLKNNRPLRNCIVYQMNKYISDLMDENTVFSNTDSLVSLKPRPDLTLSKEVGDFKIEHEGSFIYLDKDHYQWNQGRVNAANDTLLQAWEKAHNRKFILGKDNLSEIYEYKLVEFNKGTGYYEKNKIITSK